MGRDRRRAAWGAAGALAICCTIHLILLAGGIGAAATLLGGLARNPYVIVVGLAVFTVTAAVLVVKRTPEADRNSCCPPE